MFALGLFLKLRAGYGGGSIVTWQGAGGMVVHAQQPTRGVSSVCLFFGVFGSLGSPQSMLGGMQELPLPAGLSQYKQVPSPHH